MVLTPTIKKEMIDKFKLHETDTGSPEVQIGLLTHRISYLTDHVKIHKKGSSFKKRLINISRQTAETSELCTKKGCQTIQSNY